MGKAITLISSMPWLSADLKTKVLFRHRNGFEVISVMKIVALEASGSYTHVHLQDGRCILLSKTLKSLEAEMEGKRICLLRIHRSCSLNLSFISKWESDGKGAWISTADGKRWRASSLRKQQLQDTLMDYFEAI